MTVALQKLQLQPSAALDLDSEASEPETPGEAADLSQFAVSRRKVLSLMKHLKMSLKEDKDIMKELRTRYIRFPFPEGSEARSICCGLSSQQLAILAAVRGLYNWLKANSKQLSQEVLDEYFPQQDFRTVRSSRSKGFHVSWK